MKIDVTVTKTITDKNGDSINVGDTVVFTNGRKQSVIGVYDGIERGNLTFRNYLRSNEKFAVSPRLINDMVYIHTTEPGD